MDTSQQTAVAPEFGFDEALHLYTLGGRVIPGVTEILKDAGILKFGARGSELENNAAMSRGKAVHAACHYMDEDALDWSSVSDECVPYVMAYEKFRTDTGFVPTRIEERMVHETLVFAGTIDREGTWNQSKNRIVLEIKTGVKASWWGLQLSGYDILLPPITKPRNRMAVQLKDNGTYALHPFTDPNDRNMFMSLVALYWWKRNNQ